MNNIILTTTLLVAVLCLISLPISTFGLQMKPWSKPSEPASGNHHHKGVGRLEDSKISPATSSVSDSDYASPSSPGLIPALLPGFPNILGLPIPIISGLPNIPEIPNVPSISQIPQIPNIPSLPNLPALPPLSSVQSEVVSQSAEVEKCLKKDGSNTSEKCSSQIFSSWVKKDFALDKECCEIVMNMDKMCNSHVRMLFKSPFFVSLLRYSCHIKHIKN
ncbi:hypothetical protein V5N11_011132 [Cardamine amara subsp. amara]|uniref:Prolamin-like domain-containing protein n=1 Tax=Cardamine amara subsp. amara TaxID=228776 RepID=A0ABD0ZY37_CARAN